MDFTIADFVADARAATPTAAAELAVFEYDGFLEYVNYLSERLEASINRQIENNYNKVELLKNKLGALSPTNVLTQYEMRLADLSKRLDDAVNAHIIRARHSLENYANKMDGLSPAKRLAGGYSYIVNEGGANITKASQLNVNDDIRVYLSEGVVDAKVTEIN